jgi:acyl dehydratase
MSVDLASASVGDELPTLEIPTISRTTLALFAGASGDHNPIHIDLDVAKSAGLDDVFAHGMLSMAYLGRFVTNWVSQDRVLSFEARFNAITPIHATPKCVGRVVAIDTVDGERLATLEITVLLEDGTVTLSGSARVLLS